MEDLVVLEINNFRNTFAMLKNGDMKYTYADVSIRPSVLSDIRHREECNPYRKDGFLPIFAAPMSTVINLDNVGVFEENGINVILPRNIDIRERFNRSINGKWSAFSLNEFDDLFCSKDRKIISDNPIKALIDVANGHMSIIYEMVKKSKEIYGSNIIVMVGNIANPNTYEIAASVGVDYIRVSVGNGTGCNTSTHTGVNYPVVNLLSEIKDIKERLIRDGNQNPPIIIADGGIKKYADAIKALALGADYVMIGGMFCKCLESAAKTYVGNEYSEDGKWKVEIPPSRWDEIVFENGNFILDGKTIFPMKQFYGMASKLGQEDLKCKKKASEGCEKWFTVKYKLKDWVEEFTSYLRSAMSYTNAREINDFSDRADVVIISPRAYAAINE